MDGRKRVVVAAVRPEIDGGRAPIKRVLGEPLLVRADVLLDGHEHIAAAVLYKYERDDSWHEVPLEAEPNDAFRAWLHPSALGRFKYTVQAWVDRFSYARASFLARLEVGSEDRNDFLTTSRMLRSFSERATGRDRDVLTTWAERLAGDSRTDALSVLNERDLPALVRRYQPRDFASLYEHELVAVIESPRARFGSWYEFFPRSCTTEAQPHGTFSSSTARLEYAAAMGFTTVYLPPIHPIGRAHRKGKNNSLRADEQDPGSPWAIGASDGGHTAIEPKLGTFADFERFIGSARALGMDVALDIAFQCSPDHPYVKQHPEWFRKRPDGTIQYAENPPKKYQDIYPLDFETDAWESLWEELKQVVLFWVRRGVSIFRVDNPHTKPIRFWEWLIREVRREEPSTVFLSEAFTRPKMMRALAKAGFSQSYTYFTWRTMQKELREYFEELSALPSVDYFRPNVWPNTPDILPTHLHHAGPALFAVRLVLAATLSANYGIYGPAYELCENRPRGDGSEEYLDSEKYEIKRWDVDEASSLRALATLLNAVRRDHAALQWDRSLTFHDVDNPNLIAYSKRSASGEDAILTVVNLDSLSRQTGFVTLDLSAFGWTSDATFTVRDLVDDASYAWTGPRNYVSLDPARAVAHVFQVDVGPSPWDLARYY